jgi:putative NADH-flavin reductase
MKLIVFGATGTIGQHVVEQALSQGHDVTAFARNPSALDLSHERLTLNAGDALNPGDVAAAIRGHDAVLVTIGSSARTGTLRSDTTRNIIAAMQQHDVSRLICQTTLGCFESWANLNFFWKKIMFGWLIKDVFKDHEVQENLVRASDLEWTIVRPAAFTNGPATGAYKHGFGPDEPDLTLKIARADVASFMLEQLNDKTYLHDAAGISY